MKLSCQTRIRIRRKQVASRLLLLFSFCLSSCSAASARVDHDSLTTKPITTQITAQGAAGGTPDDLYRNFYEIFVYSFADSNGDGVGDLKGLTAKLDYVNDGNSTTMTDLGFDGIWLMPIMPAMTYHKYDVTDYLAIDPQYGSLEDFKALLAAAHERGIRVILDLVLNHTSTQHEWFQKAQAALLAAELDNPYIQYYHFSQKKESDTYYAAQAPGWYYQAVFWDQMPDLNLDNPALRSELESVMKYWLDLGADGFRLDAATQFYTGENARNIDVLSWIRQSVKAIKPEAYLVAEAWDSFATYSQYYQSKIDSLFEFAFSGPGGIIVRAVNSSDGQMLAEKLSQAQEAVVKIYPQAIAAPFLANHDIGRTAGFLAKDMDKIKIASAINLFSSGSSFTYYGEEIGMTGSGRDENKRAPLLWKKMGQVDSKLTKGPPNLEADKYAYPFGSVMEQEADPHSLLTYYKLAIRMKNAFPAIARGSTAQISGINKKQICAISKSWQGQEIWLLFNLSAEASKIELPADAVILYTLRAQLQGHAEAESKKQVGRSLTMAPYEVLLLEKQP